MAGRIKQINKLLVDIYNDILTIEQMALQTGSFKDLSITEMHTIEAIGMYKPRMMSEIASDLNITVGTLTTAINKLLKKGYVERNRIEEDRRVVMIQLTKRGKLAYRVHENFHSEMVQKMIVDLEDQEEESLLSALEKLNEFMRNVYQKSGKQEKECSDE